MTGNNLDDAGFGSGFNGEVVFESYLSENFSFETNVGSFAIPSSCLTYLKRNTVTIGTRLFLV